MSPSASVSAAAHVPFSPPWLPLLQVHAAVFLPASILRVYLSFRRKRGAEYASGVSRPCYSCSTRYMHGIRSIARRVPIATDQA